MWESRAVCARLFQASVDSVFENPQMWHFHGTQDQASQLKEAIMGQNRRKISPEYRNRILKEIETGQISTSQAARQYQVSRSLIEYWKKRRREGQLADQTTARERQLERENRELKAKIGELVMEMEHLKKLQHWIRQSKSADTSVITAENLDQFRKGAK
jgi:transposase-like protein